MYARLWWKDARQFWPIWLFLTLAAGSVQGLLLYYLGQDARHGALGLSALICASLYAFATGAAAFAGEREMGTLRLLDSLPIDRRVVWASKVSFALVTTLALTLILLAMAAVYTDRWKAEGSLEVWEAFSFGMIVLVALGWGLFWSASLSNALTAAVMAICSTGVSLSFPSVGLDEMFLRRADLPIVVLWQVFLFLATLIASVTIFTRIMRWKRLQVEFRSPVVINLAESASIRRVQLQIQSPVATVLAPRPISGISGSSATDQSSGQSLIVEARALAWQTMKEGGRTWCLLGTIGLVLPALLLLRWGYGTRVNYNDAHELILLISVGVSLVAGASVFGLENRSRTQRFLTHHGARPRLVWLVKLAVWGVGVTIIWVPLILTTAMTLGNFGARSLENWLSGILMIPLYFGVALLCGMAIRRGITAVVIALVIGFAMTIPLVALVVANMVPLQALLVIPAGLLIVSWAWSNDWLLDRPAPGRWVHLGLLLTGAFALIVSWYAGYRAWGIPDVGPIAPPAGWLEATSAPLPADQNAAYLYREAGSRLVGPFKDSPEFLDRNRGVLELLHRAAAQPNCRFLQVEKLTSIDQPDLPPVHQFAYLLALDTSDRQKHGDLAGAWNDIVSLFRMARQIDSGAGPSLAFSGVVWVERTALGVALEWAIAQGQTPDRLHAALAVYHDLPKMSPAVDIVRAEANLVENTLNLPTSRLRDWAFESDNGNTRSQPVFASILFDLATTPWERTRARRVNRLVARAVIQDALREPWQRSRVRNTEIDDAQKTSRNAMTLIRNMGSYVVAVDQNEVARRALVQVLALREWQFTHGGQFPQSLDAFVPKELPILPGDPYSGRPFGYVRSLGLEVSPLRNALSPSLGNGRIPAPGSWLLYSVGPDGRDDGGIAFKKDDHRSQPMDIVFEIPPVQVGGGESKGQNLSQDAVKDRLAPAGQPSSPSSPGP